MNQLYYFPLIPSVLKLLAEIPSVLKLQIPSVLKLLAEIPSHAFFNPLQSGNSIHSHYL